MLGEVMTVRTASRTTLDGKSTRRRVLLLAVGLLILLSTTPIFGHHFIPVAGLLASNPDHLYGLCVVALQSLLSPVHEGFHWLLFAGLIYAALDRLRAARELRQVLRSIRGSYARGGSVFERAAKRAGQAVESVYVVDDLPNPAFTAGWLRPRIYVSAKLEGLLTEDELTAVILHESAHVKGRDPLKLSVMRFVAATLFYVPALRRVADDLADEAEIAADDLAAASNPGVLASAILALAQFDPIVEQPPTLRESAVVSGIQRCGLLERRVRRLVGERAPARTHLTRRSLAWAIAALVAVWVSGMSIPPTVLAGTPSHPMPAGHTSEHCRHHHGSLLFHLFCPGAAFQASTPHCGHRAI